MTRGDLTINLRIYPTLAWFVDYWPSVVFVPAILVPITLDPAIILKSDQSISPLRRLCRVVQIANDQWKGLSTAGMQNAFEWLPESAEATEGSPTWTPQSIPAHKWSVYLEFSVEMQGDYGNLINHLQELMRNAYDAGTAAGYATGSGVNRPGGLLVGLDADPTVDITPASVGAVAPADLFALIEACRCAIGGPVAGWPAPRACTQS